MKRKKTRGSCLTSAFSLVVGVLICFGGIAQGREVANNRAPVEMTLAEFMEKPPDAKWVKLTGCKVSVMDSVYEYEEDDESNIDVVYVPVTTVEGSLPTNVVMKDKSYIPFIKKAIKVGNSEASFEAFLTKNADKLEEVKTFTGWVTTPSTLAKDNFDKQTVKSGFVAIDVGKKKGWTEVVIFMAIGLAMVLFGGVGLANRGG